MTQAVTFPGLDDFLRRCLEEDIGTGDITTECCVEPDSFSRGRFIAKAEGVVCGLFVAERVFYLVDGRVTFRPLVRDGDFVRRATSSPKSRAPPGAFSPASARP